MRSDLHRKGPWIFCWDCDAPGDRIREQEDAAIARQRPFRFLPVPNAKPQDYSNPYNWQAEEAQIFNLIASASPGNTPGAGPSVFAAGPAAAYMADVVTQGTRPAAWIATAKTSVVTNVAYLLTQQGGAPTGPIIAAADARYGGVKSSSSTYSAHATIGAGIAFVKAYVAIGTPDYLAAANRCATYLRRSQCGDVQATKHTVFPLGGAPYHVGGIDASVADATGLQSGSFLIDDGWALVFFAALGAVVGLSATYGDAAATTAFTAATQATLSTMIVELASFLEAGPFDSAASGAKVSPLSTTAPKSTYAAFLSDGSGSGSWGSPSTVTGIGIATALAGLFAVNGSDGTVTGVLAWLAAIAPNPANATPAANSPQQTLSGITGTFSPATSPATSYVTAAPFTEATGALYDLGALGVLAPVLNSTNVAALKNSRSIVSPIEPFSVNDLAGKYLGTLGRAGLSLQPRSTATTTTLSVANAAQFGAVYRYAIPAAYSIPGVSP